MFVKPRFRLVPDTTRIQFMRGRYMGLIVSAILTPANFDEREAALALSLSVDGGLVLGDLGYRSYRD